MIDVALTGLYDVCLFNSAAQVLFMRSGHGNPSDGLCALTSGWFEFFSGIWLFWVLSAKVFVKRQLKFYNGHLIWLLCVLCLSDYGNESPLQFIKVHQTTSDVILEEGVCTRDRSAKAPRCRWNLKGCWSQVVVFYLLLICCGRHTWNVCSETLCYSVSI